MCLAGVRIFQKKSPYKVSKDLIDINHFGHSKNENYIRNFTEKFFDLIACNIEILVL